MAPKNINKITRRDFIKQSSLTTAALAAGLYARPAWSAKPRRPSARAGKKVIIIGIDGMDPRLSEKMMNDGKLPNFAKLSNQGGFRALGTSTPPQTPVA